VAAQVIDLHRIAADRRRHQVAEKQADQILLQHITVRDSDAHTRQNHLPSPRVQHLAGGNDRERRQIESRREALADRPERRPIESPRQQRQEATVTAA
jgi:hypothetical protein